MKVDALNLTSDFNPTLRQSAENFREAKMPKAEKPVPEKKVEQAEDLTKLKQSLAEHDIALKFSRDHHTNRLVVEMIDEKTGEAIRQIPSEVSLKLAAQFVKLQGQFVDEVE